MNVATSLCVIAILTAGITVARLNPKDPSKSLETESGEKLVLRETRSSRLAQEMVDASQSTTGESSIPVVPIPLEASVDLTSQNRTSTISTSTRKEMELPRRLPKIQNAQKNSRSLPGIQRLPKLERKAVSDQSRNKQPPEKKNCKGFILHRIHDGDDLKSLAAHYLNDQRRYLEIYEINRDRLPHPDILPLGIELKIPLQRQNDR